VYAKDPDLVQIGHALEQLGYLRNQADYQLAAPGPFANAKRAVQAVQQSGDAITLLDQIEADPAHRAAAIAAIQSTLPPP
jgi:hypothetical protein